MINGLFCYDTVYKSILLSNKMLKGMNEDKNQKNSGSYIIDCLNGLPCLCSTISSWNDPKLNFRFEGTNNPLEIIIHL